MTSVAVFGLGYVGTVTAASLAAGGHRVIGVDISAEKVAAIGRGISPVVEKGLAERVANAVAVGRLTATMSVEAAVSESDVSLVCVGTPSQPDGSIDLSSVMRVCESIGRALRDKDGFHVVVIRSTLLPGSFASVLCPILEAASGKRAGTDFGACVNPEYLREGNAIDDYDHPAKIVIGEIGPPSGDRVAELYRSIDAPIARMSVEMAAFTKYVDNAWHALKVVFANEIGAVSAAIGLDGREVMKVFALDTKLNVSSAYLAPGFAFGGSCLPKDLRALQKAATTHGVAVPLLDAVSLSNDHHIERAARRVLSTDNRRIGICGLAFKPGTDDLRESPFIRLARILIAEGCDLRLFDRNVRRGTIMGQNREIVLSQIPNFDSLLVGSVTELLDFARVVVIGSDSDLGRPTGDRIIIDLGAVRAA